MPNHSCKTPKWTIPSWLLPERTSPMIIKYMIKQPRLVIITHICTAEDHSGPNASLMTPA
uniref:Uncharacterized protein n=1 Tax=Rhizophora mucronata TaxID=61149 RepID=A0A2P2NM14_RHIMU